MEPAAANQTGRSLAPMLIYILMATVLFFRPSGLFPVEQMTHERQSNCRLAPPAASAAHAQQPSRWSRAVRCC